MTDRLKPSPLDTAERADAPGVGEAPVGAGVAQVQDACKNAVAGVCTTGGYEDGHLWGLNDWLDS